MGEMVIVGEGVQNLMEIQRSHLPVTRETEIYDPGGIGDEPSKLDRSLK